MTNRFDTSQEHQYVSSYIPLPFETIAALGDKIQKKQDAAIDDTYKLKDLMTKVQAIHDPNLGLSNIKKKQELDSQFAPKIDELVNKIYQGDPNAYRELEQIKRDFVNNPIRQELEESYTNYKAYKDDITKKGDAYAIYKDKYRNQPLISETGELTPFRFSGLGEKQNHAEEARAQMADIAKSGFDFKNSYLDPNDGNIYTKGSSGKYVKDERVRQLAKFKTDKFIQTQKGQDYLELLHYQNPNATPEELAKGVEDYLYAAGVNQVFSDIGGETGVKTTSLTAGRDAEKRAADIVTTNEQGNPESTNIDSVYKALGIDGILDEKGEFVTPGMFDSEYTAKKLNGETKTFKTSEEAHKFAGSTGTIVQKKLDNSKSAKEIVDQGYAALAAKSKQLGLPEPFIVDQQGNKKFTGDYRKQMYEYAIGIAKRASTTSKLQQSTIQGMNKAMFGPNSDISNMEFYNQGDESSNAKVTNEYVSSMAENSTVTGVDFFGHNQAGLKVAVTPKDKNGKSVGVDKPLIAVPRDKGFEEDTRAVHKISRGVLEFSRTGKIDSKYIDTNVKDQLQSKLNNSYKQSGWGKAPELVATSMEINRFGETVMMGTYLDNSNGQPNFKAVTYTIKKDGTPEFKESSLDAVQINKTKELETKGSLNQYNTSLKETVKPSEVNDSDEDQ